MLLGCGSLNYWNKLRVARREVSFSKLLEPMYRGHRAHVGRAFLLAALPKGLRKARYRMHRLRPQWIPYFPLPKLNSVNLSALRGPRTAGQRVGSMLRLPTKLSPPTHCEISSPAKFPDVLTAPDPAKLDVPSSSRI